MPAPQPLNLEPQTLNHMQKPGPVGFGFALLGYVGEIRALP